MQSHFDHHQSDFKAAVARAQWARPRTAEWTLPGLCWNAHVTTSFGEMPIQGLRRNDPVRTVTGAFVKVVATDRMKLDEEFLEHCPDAAPVRIPANCFGPGRPRNDLLVSPHQMIATSANPSAPELRRARDLLQRPGVMRQPSFGHDYYLFHCGISTSISVEGVLIPTAP
ncbi:Hint domain-containing protein [Defluviimonas sp. WL0075]|uniref:Hint domain-containing protein n=1 Tax=Albidovulum sediminicola TaxID=2984331 RepID=A0ABT2Z151_9RHOB|nr:Hint domain-containing protein [Defluviimonas sp. WL0075]MCV2864742.1 Hint domain-containing protein [Defluviimonas sp. WL0075]